MRYQVPQFIEIEDKIVGPLTIKQFLWPSGGAGMAFIIYKFVNIILALPLIIIVATLSAALAFYRINNKPFIDFLEAAFLYYTKQNLYIWKKEPKVIEPKKEEPKEPEQVYVPRLSESKLKEISWSLDINESLNPLTGDDGRNTA